MTKKEMAIQKALGLEKGFITQFSIEVPVYVSVPIIAKGVSIEEVRERLYNLPDTIKKRIIKHTCRVMLTSTLYEDTASDLGNDVFDVIETISRNNLKNIDTAQLDTDNIEIDTDTGVDTITCAVNYLKEELYLTEDEILII